MIKKYNKKQCPYCLTVMSEDDNKCLNDNCKSYYKGKSNMEHDYIHPIEREIVESVIKYAIDKGYAVSLDNGGEGFEFHKSTDFDYIKTEIGQSDTDCFSFSNEGKGIGMMIFVYGNEPYCVLSDYSVNDKINELANVADNIAAKYDTHEACLEQLKHHMKA